MSTIPQGKVPAWPIGAITFLAIGIILGIASFVTISFSSIFSVVVIISLSGFAITIALFFYWLLTQRQTPIGDLKVGVGDKLLPFAVVDSDGKSFHSEQLQGKRVLLKFFRGGW